MRFGFQLVCLLVFLSDISYGQAWMPKSKTKEMEAYTQASIDLNRWVRTLQISGGRIPRAPQEKDGLVILWNERLFCFAAPEYEETALDIRVLTQLLQLFKAKADAAGENLPPSPIFYLAYAQRVGLIQQSLAEEYNAKVQNYKLYYNEGKSTFDSLTDPLPWIGLATATEPVAPEVAPAEVESVVPEVGN